MKASDAANLNLFNPLNEPHVDGQSAAGTALIYLWVLLSLLKYRIVSTILAIVKPKTGNPLDQPARANPGINKA